MSHRRQSAADVSVVVPTFRRQAALREAISSVLSQQEVSLTVHVLDDSPEGSARETVEAFQDDRITFVHRSTPSGGKPAEVRNDGWPRTQGRYLHFLDDDDRVPRGAYRAMVSALDGAPTKGVVFGRVAPFGDNRTVLEQQTRYFENAAKRARRAAILRSRRWMVANMLFRPTVLVCSACMIRRECLENLGGFSLKMPVVEDVDFYIRAIRRCGFVFLDRPVIEYRTGLPSLMHDLKDNSRVEHSYQEMYRSYQEAYGRLELTSLKVLARTLFRWI